MVVEIFLLSLARRDATEGLALSKPLRSSIYLKYDVRGTVAALTIALGQQLRL